MPYETHVTSLIRVAGLAACVLLFCAAAGCTTATETPPQLQVPGIHLLGSNDENDNAGINAHDGRGGSTAAVTITDLNCKAERVKIKNTGTLPVFLTGWRISDEVPEIPAPSRHLRLHQSPLSKIGVAIFRGEIPDAIRITPETASPPFSLLSSLSPGR